MLQDLHPIPSPYSALDISWASEGQGVLFLAARLSKPCGID